MEKLSCVKKCNLKKNKIIKKYYENYVKLENFALTNEIIYLSNKDGLESFK